MSADELAEAVEEYGAFPMPVPVVPEPLSAERLAEIDARAEAATAGPWWTDTLAEHDGSESVGIDTKGDIWIVPCQDIDHADAEFMAHAREDVPALVAEVRRQAARIAELEAERHSTNEALDDAVQALRANAKPSSSFAERADRETDPARRTAWRMLAQDVADGEHFSVVHHDWRLGRDLPETGGAGRG